MIPRTSIPGLRAIILIVIVLAGCNQTDDSVQPGQVDHDNYVAKWIVNDPESGFKSIEFVKSRYLIIDASDHILYGEVIPNSDGTNLQLVDFGSVTIVYQNTDAAAILLSQTGRQEELSVSRAPEFT